MNRTQLIVKFKTNWRLLSTLGNSKAKPRVWATGSNLTKFSGSLIPAEESICLEKTAWPAQGDVPAPRNLWQRALFPEQIRRGRRRNVWRQQLQQVQSIRYTRGYYRTWKASAYERVMRTGRTGSAGGNQETAQPVSGRGRALRNQTKKTDSVLQFQLRQQIYSYSD